MALGGGRHQRTGRTDPERPPAVFRRHGAWSRCRAGMRSRTPLDSNSACSMAAGLLRTLRGRLTPSPWTRRDAWRRISRDFRNCLALPKGTSDQVVVRLHEPMLVTAHSVADLDRRL